MTSAQIERLLHEACSNAVCAGEHDVVLRAVNVILECAARSCMKTVPLEDANPIEAMNRITIRPKSAAECAAGIRAMKVLR